MGAVIKKNRSADVILKDLGEAIVNSAAMGGKVAELAAGELGPVQAMVDQLDADLAAARKAATPLLAAASMAQAKAEQAIHLTYDLTRNYIGRPKLDAKLAILFPGGARHYIEGNPEQLPTRMELLAVLFDKGIHPKLSEAQNKAASEGLRAAAKAHREALVAASLPETKVEMLEKTRTATGQLAQGALMNFKRLLKNAGYTEAQIHRVIPNRAQSAGKKAVADAEGGASPAAQARAGESQG